MQEVIEILYLNGVEEVATLGNSFVNNPANIL